MWGDDQGPTHRKIVTETTLPDRKQYTPTDDRLVNSVNEKLDELKGALVRISSASDQVTINSEYAEAKRISQDIEGCLEYLRGGRGERQRTYSVGKSENMRIMSMIERKVSAASSSDPIDDFHRPTHEEHQRLQQQLIPADGLEEELRREAEAEMRALRSNMVEINELSREMAFFVHSQQEHVDRVEAQAEETEATMVSSVQQLASAAKHESSSWRLKSGVVGSVVLGAATLSVAPLTVAAAGAAMGAGVGVMVAGRLSKRHNRSVDQVLASVEQQQQQQQRVQRVQREQQDQLRVQQQQQQEEEEEEQGGGGRRQQAFYYDGRAGGGADDSMGFYRDRNGSRNNSRGSSRSSSISSSITSGGDAGVSAAAAAAAAVAEPAWLHSDTTPPPPPATPLLCS